ncbi:hypothetical protein [Brachybacterium sp.]|uniref:hypothetical protein n=1 Tax=Brachybacterium sp. TaxID=1891286 RepID=UPI002ED4B4F8
MNTVAGMLQDAVDDRTLPGAVALLHRQGLTDAVVVGAQDLESGTPISRRTLLHGDSLGTPLTAAPALTFVADGRLELDGPAGSPLLAAFEGTAGG